MHSRLRPFCIAAAMLVLLAMPPLGARGAQPTSDPIVVTASSDENVCPSQFSLTLRCAINTANLNPFTNITFASNIRSVVLTGPLPVLSADGTWIDGNNANPVVRIDGAVWDTSSNNTGNAFTITGSNVTLSNLTVVNIPPGGADVFVSGGHNANIDHDSLGIQPGADQCSTDTDYGVELDSDTQGTTGRGSGVAYIFGNTISCHAFEGIYVLNTNYVSIGVDENYTVIGNKIGTTSDGLHPAGNGSGIFVEGNASQNSDIHGNLIADNTYDGVNLYFDANYNSVEFNDIVGNGRLGIASSSGNGNGMVSNNIGTNMTGTTHLSNGSDGIRISGGTGTPVYGNVIFYNGGKGISVLGDTTQAQILDNRIGANGGLPIDLNGDGPSPNGAHFGNGPDGWLYYPTVTQVNGTSLFGSTCDDCQVYVYRAIGNPQAPGGGGIPITSVTANSSGQWSVNLPSGMSRGDVTFTAVDVNKGTSEMSPRPQLMLPLLRR